MNSKRTIIAIGAILLLLIVAEEFQACFWTRGYAHEQALRRVKRACMSSGLDATLLVEGMEGTAGGAIWSFEWTYQGQPRRLFGTWISRAGHVEIYTGNPDDPESAAHSPY